MNLSLGFGLDKYRVRNGTLLNYNPADDTDINFRSVERSGLSLVDSVDTNNATILPAVAQFNTTGNIYLTLGSAITFTSGEVIIHAYQPVSSTAGGLLYGGGGTDFITLRADNTIGVRFSSTLKLFTVANLSLTGLNVIRVVVTAVGSTKIRVYCNGVESSSGEQDCAALKNFVFNFVGAGSGLLQKISYVNVVNAGSTVLSLYPTGLGLYEYDCSGQNNNATWTGTPTTVFVSGANQYLLNSGYSVYEKVSKSDEYVPYGASAAALITAEYQLKETHAGSASKHNLAPSLIQFAGASFDRSDATIWSNSARAGYYDATSATTKKRWHINECTQYNFGTWANEAYKEIIFVKYQYSTHADGRALTEIFAVASAKTAVNLELIYKYIGYNYKVGSLTTQFVVNTILGQLDWVDNSGGLAQYEISRTVNGGTRSVVATTAAGVITYNDTTCKQGAWVIYYIRAKVGSVYSDYFRTSILNTPLCWKTDQSTLTAVVLNTLNLNSGTVNVNWGDNTNANYTLNNANVTKNYASTGQYNIVLTGDLRRINVLEHYEQVKSYGDIGNWVFPIDWVVFHMFGCSFTGDISDHITYFKPAFKVYDAQRLPITGDVSGWRWRNTAVYDIHFESTEVTGDITNWDFQDTVNSASAKVMLFDTLLTGNLTGWILPEGQNKLLIYGSHFTIDLRLFHVPTTLVNMDINSDAVNTNTVSGDMTGFVFPTTDSQFTNMSLKFNYCNLTGDMSGSLIPNMTKEITLQFNHNAITKLPRGNFKWISEFAFSYNNCNTAEIDSFLAYVDAYFTGGVVPLCNAAYLISGTNMGVPSAAGLASRTSIINKYIAAGKTCTITVST